MRGLEGWREREKGWIGPHHSPPPPPPPPPPPTPSFSSYSDSSSPSPSLLLVIPIPPTPPHIPPFLSPLLSSASVYSSSSWTLREAQSLKQCNRTTNPGTYTGGQMSEINSGIPADEHQGPRSNPKCASGLRSTRNRRCPENARGRAPTNPDTPHVYTSGPMPNLEKSL